MTKTEIKLYFFRYLYYSDWHRENPVIGRVHLDGTGNSAFVTTEVNLPNGYFIVKLYLMDVNM